MPFALLHSRFPEVARLETRSITVLGGEELPGGSYGFLELFCDEEGCDCRRAFIHVVRTSDRSPSAPKPLATISFGWEKESFYRAWASFPLSRDDVAELKGPALARMSPQSKYAPVLLRHFKILLSDEAYRDRIVRHYEMFRATVDEEAPAKLPVTVVRPEAKTGRNDPCPCGSGKKFKKCCFDRGVSESS